MAIRTKKRSAQGGRPVVPGRERTSANDSSAPAADALEADRVEDDTDDFDEPPAERDTDDAVGLEEDVSLTDDDADDDDGSLNIDLDAMPGQCSDRELSIRRAIEERREARRLRDDLDYLDFDD